jgi:hypothetical protein
MHDHMGTKVIAGKCSLSSHALLFLKEDLIFLFFSKKEKCVCFFFYIF